VPGGNRQHGDHLDKINSRQPVINIRRGESGAGDGATDHLIVMPRCVLFFGSVTEVLVIVTTDVRCLVLLWW
jgi:hypothetical protein